MHAACSPSGAAMWLACPASITLTKGMERPSSRFAREGTAAHKVAELIIGGDPFLPDKVEVEGQEFVVTREMCRALRAYVHDIEYLRREPGARVFIEQRVVIPHTFSRVWGTVDCGVVTDRSLHVLDLKYGKGVAVDPESPQLKLYALGLMAMEGWDSVPYDLDVTLTVHQPRVGDGAPQTVHTTAGALELWHGLFVVPALERIQRGDTTERAGPHCRFCVRQKDCAAFARKHQERAATLFDDPVDNTSPPG